MGACEHENTARTQPCFSVPSLLDTRCICTDCEQKLAGYRALVGSSMLSGMHAVHAVDLAPCTHPWGRPKIAPVAFPRQAFCKALHLLKAAMSCREVL